MVCFFNGSFVPGWMYLFFFYELQCGSFFFSIVINQSDFTASQKTQSTSVSMSHRALSFWCTTVGLEHPGKDFHVSVSLCLLTPVGVWVCGDVCVWVCVCVFYLHVSVNVSDWVPVQAERRRGDKMETTKTSDIPACHSVSTPTGTTTDVQLLSADPSTLAFFFLQEGDFPWES